MFGDDIQSQQNYRDNVVNNPHILDWFFTERTEPFVKHWLYNILGAKWHWYRYEFSVLRGAIHCHGLAKLESDPGLCELANKAVDAFQGSKNIANASSIAEDNIEIVEGKNAEREICAYYDYLISCVNDGVGVWEKPEIHPCRKKLNDVIE